LQVEKFLSNYCIIGLGVSLDMKREVAICRQALQRHVLPINIRAHES
jgi:hypothetical protein